MNGVLFIILGWILMIKAGGKSNSRKCDLESLILCFMGFYERSFACKISPNEWIWMLLN